MRTSIAVLAVLFAVSCSKPPPKEAAVPDASVKAPEPVAPAPSAAGLKKISDSVSSSCAAEFARAAKDQLQPGPEQACELGVSPELIYSDSTSRPSLAELAESMKGTCADLQKEVDLALKRAGTDNTASTRNADAEYALKQYERTWVVGLVKDPKAKAGTAKGDVYLYRVGSGKLECAAKVDVKGSAAELDKAVTEAVKKAPKLALQAGPPPKAGKGAKAAPAPNTKKKGKK